MEFKISVQSLVEFMLRIGDLDSRDGCGPNREAMQKGSRLHRKIQKSQKASYQSGVPLFYIQEYPEYSIKLEGRADGIFAEGIDLVGDRLIGALIVGTGLPQISYERKILQETALGHFLQRPSPKGQRTVPCLSENQLINLIKHNSQSCNRIPLQPRKIFPSHLPGHPAPRRNRPGKRNQPPRKRSRLRLPFKSDGISRCMKRYHITWFLRAHNQSP